MRAAGYLLIVLGLPLLAWGLVMGVSIDAARGAEWGPGALSRVVNLGLMTQKISLLLAGGFLFLAGCVLRVGADLKPRRDGGPSEVKAAIGGVAWPPAEGMKKF